MSITSPATSELAEYVLSGEAADDVGVVELAFQSNQSSERPLLEVEGRFGSFVALEVGDNTIEVVARDAAGNETSSAITVTYRPEPETPPLDEPGGPNSLSAIDEALADGEIDEESAILYRVYAAFGDDRLPSELDVGGLIDAGSVLRDANERFETLSTPAQEALRPYFVPPIYAESWYRDPLGANAAELPVTKGGVPLTCEEEAAPDWHYIEAAKVRVWWNSLRHDHGDIAFAVLNALEARDAAWPTLTELMGKTPPIDSEKQEISKDGCSDHYDVYIVHLRPNASGDLPYWAFVHPHEGSSGCAPWPSYMVVAGNSAASSGRRRYMMAHEFMHSLQYAYRSCLGDDALHWVAESTAHWAIDYVEPRATDPAEPMHHFEHLYARNGYLDSLDESIYLGDQYYHAYGSYVWPLFITKRHGDSFIRDLWEGLGMTRDLNVVLSTMNGLVPGGFSEEFPEFMLRAWNQEPVWTAKPGSNFNAWDSMTVSPSSAMSTSVQQISANVAGQKDRKILLALGVEPLAAEVVHIRFDDPDVSSALLSNGYTFDLKEGVPPRFPSPSDSTAYADELDEELRKGRHVWGMVKQDGKWLEAAFDLTDVAFITICQDVLEESAEEIVLIFTNSRWQDDEPAMPKGLGSRLFVSKMSCGAWEGRGTVDAQYDDGSFSSTVDVALEDLRFTRVTRTIADAMGGRTQSNFLGTIVPSKNTRYRLETARVPWMVSASYERDGMSCSLAGSGTLDQTDVTSASSFRVDPFLNGAVGEGSLYQSYRVDLQFHAPEQSVVDSCGEDGGFSFELSGGPRDPEVGDFLISDDGRRIQRTWTVNDATYSLDLQALRVISF